MTATVDQQLEDVLAELGDRERQQVLEYARTLRREEDDEEERVFMEMIEFIHAAMHRLRMRFDSDFPREVVVIRTPDYPRPHADAGFRRSRPRPDRHPD